MEKKKIFRCCGILVVVLVGTFMGLFYFTNMNNAFDYIEEQDGLAVFFHPKRYSEPIEWYNDLFDEYQGTLIGMEVFNKGDLGYSDRDFWDGINRLRSPDDLVWGFSNDDWHRESHSFRNYQHMLMSELTETELRNSMEEGAFYFSREPNGANQSCEWFGIAMAPKLMNVSIDNWIINVAGEDYDSIEWYNSDTENILNGTTINISLIETTNFVRVVLINEFGETYSQPFGLTEDTILNPYSSVDWAVDEHYKANFHTHTTQSDGDKSPKEVIEMYHSAGYKILAIADHNKNTWPWKDFIEQTPDIPSKTAEYYPDLDMLALSANEASGSHHFGSFFNDYSGFALDLRFLLRDIMN